MTGFLFDVKVLELADEKGEFLGTLLTGAGGVSISGIIISANGE